MYVHLFLDIFSPPITPLAPLGKTTIAIPRCQSMSKSWRTLDDNNSRMRANKLVENSVGGHQKDNMDNFCAQLNVTHTPRQIISCKYFMDEISDKTLSRIVGVAANIQGISVPTLTRSSSKALSLLWWRTDVACHRNLAKSLLWLSFIYGISFAGHLRGHGSSRQQDEADD